MSLPSPYVYTCVCVRSGQKRVLDLMEQEFQAVVNYLMWVLGTQLGFPARGACVLNC